MAGAGFPNTESASVRAVSEASREPKEYRVKTEDGTDISTGGAITVVYLPKNDEIHIYYIGKDKQSGKETLYLREACLRGAKNDGAPKDWTTKDMHLNGKRFKIDPHSLLCSAIDTNEFPRVFYNELDELERVNFASYGLTSEGKRDWTTTTFTGVGG